MNYQGVNQGEITVNCPCCFIHFMRFNSFFFVHTTRKELEIRYMLHEVSYGSVQSILIGKIMIEHFETGLYFISYGYILNGHKKPCNLESRPKSYDMLICHLSYVCRVPSFHNKYQFSSPIYYFHA